MKVQEVAVETAYDLRRRVLRDGRADAVVAFPEDDTPGTLHLAISDSAEKVVAVATFIPQATIRRPDARAWRLRGMAVEPECQGQGIGRQLLDAGVARARSQGVDVIWAEGRDSALSFYTGLGWIVEGDGYLTAIGIAHHDVVLDLS